MGRQARNEASATREPRSGNASCPQSPWSWNLWQRVEEVKACWNQAALLLPTGPPMTGEEQLSVALESDKLGFEKNVKCKVKASIPSHTDL